MTFLSLWGYILTRCDLYHPRRCVLTRRDLPHPQAVLERGVLTYFSCRADASSGVKRKEFRYLDGARVAAGESPEGATMVLRFNDGTMHRLRCDDGDDRVSRQVSTGGRVDRLSGVTRQTLSSNRRSLLGAW